MKLTRADFQMFIKECKKWEVTYGLSDHRIDYRFEAFDENYAQTVGNNSRSFMVGINTEWIDIELTPIEKASKIKECAYHEMTEVMLYRLRMMAVHGKANDEEIDAEVHSILYRLQRILYQPVGE